MLTLLENRIFSKVTLSVDSSRLWVRPVARRAIDRFVGSCPCVLAYNFKIMAVNCPEMGGNVLPALASPCVERQLLWVTADV